MTHGRQPNKLVKRSENVIPSASEESLTSPAGGFERFLTSFGMTRHGLVQRPTRSGFTLIEIMAVVVIIGLLTTIVTVSVQQYLRKAREEKARAQVKNTSLALDTYEMRHHHYPSTVQGLRALVSAPAGMSDWQGPFLDPPVLRQDPWDRDYVYKYPGEKYPTKYDLYSLGPDGAEGTEDDITNWK